MFIILIHKLINCIKVPFTQTASDLLILNQNNFNGRIQFFKERERVYLIKNEREQIPFSRVEREQIQFSSELSKHWK